MKENANSTLKASWASHSLAQRALAYHRVRFFGSLAILILLFVVQLRYPNNSPIQAIFATCCDLAILVWQRSMALHGRPRLATWISLITAAVIGTFGLYLGGGFITLSFGIYLILILSAAFVFWQRSAAYWMSAVVGFLFLFFITVELAGFIGVNNILLISVYDLNINARLIYTNIVLGVLLILITMVAAGGAAETMGNWSITLTNEVKRKTKELTELHDNMALTYRNIVALLANVLEARDQYTIDHSNRISTLAVETARMLNYTDEELERVRLAAILHDIGKIGVPDSILNKPASLTAEEREIMKRHPDIGADIIATIDELGDIAEIVRAHQEKFDGSGYPNGLREDEIPLAARIITVVDAYIAITDERPYKTAKSKAFAIKELISHTKKQFDPQVVDAFLYVLQLENSKEQK